MTGSAVGGVGAALGLVGDEHRLHALERAGNGDLGRAVAARRPQHGRRLGVATGPLDPDLVDAVALAEPAPPRATSVEASSRISSCTSAPGAVVWATTVRASGSPPASSAPASPPATSRTAAQASASPGRSSQPPIRPRRARVRAGRSATLRLRPSINRERLGLDTDAVRSAALAFGAGDSAPARALITDEVLDQILLRGTPAEVGARLASSVRAHQPTSVGFSLLTPNLERGLEDSAEAFAAMRRHLAAGPVISSRVEVSA